MKDTNPWPIVVTLAIVFFIGSVVAFVFWSLGHRIDLVAPDYYEQEITYQDQIDREVRTRQLTGEHGLRHNREAGVLVVRIPPEHAGAEGRIELYRPSDASQDRLIVLETDEVGSQEIPLAGYVPGLWRARLKWTFADHEYFVETVVMVE